MSESNIVEYKFIEKYTKFPGVCRGQCTASWRFSRWQDVHDIVVDLII